MIMNKRILSILSAISLFSFVACTNEDEPITSTQKGEVRFSVIDTTQVEVETKAITGLDVNDFTCSVVSQRSMDLLFKEIQRHRRNIHLLRDRYGLYRYRRELYRGRGRTCQQQLGASTCGRQKGI